jgi:hypothetical protein
MLNAVLHIVTAELETVNGQSFLNLTSPLGALHKTPPSDRVHNNTYNMTWQFPL